MRTRYRCAICGRRLEEGRYVYSRFTKNRYCTDIARHEAIVRRKRRLTK
jgi:hypothetical protein